MSFYGELWSNEQRKQAVTSTCVLVIGTPRSGTSCVAGLCHKLGIMMGEPLISEDGNPRFDWPGADEWNATGYYQDAPMENLESAIFSDGFAGWSVDELQPEHEARLAEIIALRESYGVDWGSKTSRMGFLLPHFLRLCKSDVRIITTTRLKSESVASWKAMIGHSDEKSQAIIDATASVRDMVKTLGVPTLNVTFDDLMASPEIIGQIAEFVGRGVTDAARQHVDAGLRRHNHSDPKAG